MEVRLLAVVEAPATVARRVPSGEKMCFVVVAVPVVVAMLKSDSESSWSPSPSL